MDTKCEECSDMSIKEKEKMRNRILLAVEAALKISVVADGNSEVNTCSIMNI